MGGCSSSGGRFHSASLGQAQNEGYILQARQKILHPAARRVTFKIKSLEQLDLLLVQVAKASAGHA
jgi:hypothetical protein